MKRRVDLQIALVALLLAGFFATACPADDSEKTATAPVRNGIVADNLNRVEYQAVLDALARFDFYPEDFDIRVVENEPRYRLEMSRGLGPAWRIRSNLTKQQYDSVSAQLVGEGYELRIHRQYAINGQQLHAVLFVMTDHDAGSGTAGVQGG